MRSRDVQIGEKYVAKVNGGLTDVQVLEEKIAYKRHGRRTQWLLSKEYFPCVLQRIWIVLNLETSRRIIFTSARRFLRKANEHDAR